MIKIQIVAALCGLCIMASTEAQTNQSKDETAAAWSPTFNIDFRGGTPEELVRLVAKESGASPNVIIPTYVTDVQLPKFKLHNVNTSQVFEALNMVADDKGNQYVRWISEGERAGPNRVWTLARALPKQAPETCQVAFIGFLLEAFSVEDINAAIRAAWEMSGKPSTASLKFHKETKLLIAKGNGEELKLAFDVLQSLEQAAGAKKRGDANK